METETQQGITKKRPAPPHAFKPGTSGNPAGRPVLAPEERQKRALEKKVQERVILDIAAEMRQHAAAAVKALRKVVDTGDGAEVTGAARLLLSYAFGTPREAIDLTINQGTRLVTPEEIRQAALRLAAGRAEDAEDLFG